LFYLRTFSIAFLAAGIFGASAAMAATPPGAANASAGLSLPASWTSAPQGRRAQASGSIFGVTPWAASQLYTFGGTNGSEPDSLTPDAAGNIYGTTFVGGLACGCGTVFKLARPGPDHTAWTETVLHAFSGNTDGVAPDSALVIDKNGALYGTTYTGGNVGWCINGCGTVFKLTPPAAGKTVWTETIIHYFTGLSGDGALPYFSNLIVLNGVLYGTTSSGGVYGGGTAYMLVPPGPGKTAWNATTIHSFAGAGALSDGSNPQAGLIAAGGALYSTTAAGGGTGCGGSGCGIVYQLKPPATGQAWIESVLHTFNSGVDGSSPSLALATDASGALYTGAEYGGNARCNSSRGCGTVFKLTPPTIAQTAWTGSVLHYFNGKDGYFPYSGLLADANGDLYGATEGGGPSSDGTVFELAAPTPSKPAWSQNMVHAFSGGVDGASPAGNLIETGGSIYGSAAGGGAACGCGLVFKLQP
jgi:uncharacterized repeat protein (TIGR03803 family)